MSIAVHRQLSTAAATQPNDTVRMNLSPLVFTRVCVDDFGPHPVLTQSEWRNVATKQHRQMLHTADIQLVPRSGARVEQAAPIGFEEVQKGKGERVALAAAGGGGCAMHDTCGSGNSAEWPRAHVVSLFAPHNWHLHFYARPPQPRGGGDGGEGESGKKNKKAAAPDLKKRKIEVVAYRRSSSLVEMNTTAVVRAALTPDAATTTTSSSASPPRRLVDLRRQLPFVAFASSFWEPSSSSMNNAVAVPEPASYPVIRAVPLFFSPSQLCGVGHSPLTTKGFRRTWGLKQVNAHVITRRSGATTPPPQPSAPSSLVSPNDEDEERRSHDTKKRRR